MKTIIPASETPPGRAVCAGARLVRRRLFEYTRTISVSFPKYDEIGCTAMPRAALYGSQQDTHWKKAHAGAVKLRGAFEQAWRA